MRARRKRRRSAGFLCAVGLFLFAFAVPAAPLSSGYASCT